MAATRVGTLVVDLIAESAQYIAELRRANQQTSRFARDVSRSMKSLAGNVAGLAAGYLGLSAVIGKANQAMANAREIETMARLAGQSVEDFQAAAYATDRYGVSAEKLGDISKDVSDKLGDFIATGGGEMKDFFEIVAPQVGLTAQELQHLSGPEVLLRMKAAMDQANIPMKQQIFYLEGIANDASLLIPLLENSGEQYHALAKEARDLNVILSEQDISNLREMDRQLQQVSARLESSFAQAVVGASEQIDWLTDQLATAVTWWGTFFDSMNDEPGTIDGLVEKMVDLQDELDELQDKIEHPPRIKTWLGDSPVLYTQQETEQLRKEYERRRAMVQQEMDALQILYNQKMGVPSRESPVISITSGADASQINLSQLQESLRTREELVLESYRKQAAGITALYGKQQQQINDLVLTEEQARAAGYESQLALQRDFLDRAAEQRDLAMSDLRDKTREDLDEITEQYGGFWEKWAMHLQESAASFDDIWTGAFDSFASSFGQAVADSIVSGESFGDAMDNIAVNFSKSMIAAMVEMAAQQVALWVMQNTVLKGMQVGEVVRVTGEAQAGSMLAAINAYASTAAIPIEGPILAPAMAAMALATTQAMAATATAAATSAMAGMAHSGISSIPDEGTWLLKKRERVLDPEQNADLTRFLQGQRESEPVINNQFTFVIESGASQEADQDMASNIYNEFTARLIADARMNGPVRRAMNGG